MRFNSIVFGCVSAVLLNVPQVQAQVECPLGWAAGPLLSDLQGANGPVHALLTYDPPGALPPTLIVGGEFTRIGNIAANNIASWDGTIWRPLGDGTDHHVYALTVYNNNLIVGGRFHHAGGNANKFIAAWNGSNWLSIGNTLIGDGIDCSISFSCNGVWSLGVFNGDLFAGGYFYIPGFQNEDVTGIARLVASTNWAPLFTVGTDPWFVGTMQVFDDDGTGPNAPALYVGGHTEDPFWSNFLKWSNGQWTPITYYWGNVHALTLTNQGLMVGGYFMLEPSADDVMYVARWSGSLWTQLGTSTNWGGGSPFTHVTALSQFGNDLYASGHFIEAGGTAVQNMARWNGAQWISTGFLFSGENYRAMNELRVHNNELYAGGDFNLADANGEINHLAKYNGSTWSSIRTATSVNALATIGSNWLVFGGDFGHVDGLANTLDPYYLGIWNGKDFEVLGGGVNGPVHALESWNGFGINVVVAGGAFTLAGSQGGIGTADGGGGTDGAESANRIAMWTDALIEGGWQPMGNGFNNTVLAVERGSSGAIFAGGQFTASGTGSPAFNRIAKWAGSPGNWIALDAGLNNTVRALKASSIGGVFPNPAIPIVVAGGDFTTADGVAANRIAYWKDGATHADEGWVAMGAGFNNSVYAIEVHSGGIYAGGAFTASGATALNHVARWTGTAWVAVGSGLNGNVYALRSYNGHLFAACEVTVGGGLTFSRWNGTSWTSVDGGVTFGAAKAIMPFRTELVVGGTFEKAQGTTVESAGLARYRYQGIPWIIRQPTAQSFPCRAPVTFKVDIPTGYEGLMAFQWFKDGQPISLGWTNTGSFRTATPTGDTLTILDISDADEGAYHVVFTTACGSVASNPATLTANVTCPSCPWDIAYGDAGDGYVGVPDLLAIVNKWGTNDDRADVSEDGIVGVPDLLAIINHWGACPF